MASTFHPFSKLPPELRLDIWEYATTFLGPRLITLIAHPSSKTLLAHTSDNGFLDSLYWACRDSHYTMKKIKYRLSFHHQLGGIGILFHPEIDTLYFSTPNALKLFHDSTFCLPSHPTHKVQTIAMYLPMAKDPVASWIFSQQMSFDILYRVLKNMNGLQKIIFVDTFGKDVEVPYMEVCRTKGDFVGSLHAIERCANEVAVTNGVKRGFLTDVRFCVEREGQMRALSEYGEEGSEGNGGFELFE